MDVNGCRRLKDCQGKKECQLALFFDRDKSVHWQTDFRLHHPIYLDGQNVPET
jgi:hypothetical protein